MFARNLVSSSRTAARSVRPTQMMAVRGLKSKPIFTANTTVKGARQGSVVGGTYSLVPPYNICGRGEMQDAVLIAIFIPFPQRPST